MVRQLHMEMDDEVFENTHPGCIWGVFHALNYIYWQKNVKKILPYGKSHNQTKYSKGTARPRARLIAYDSDDTESLLDVETSRFPVNTKTRKTSPTKKRSLRKRIKSLISEEPQKKEKRGKRGSISPIKPKFQRTFSIHHLECSDYVLEENPFPDKYETEKRNNVDVLEIYGVNKDIFTKVTSFNNLENRTAHANLMRSGSYPSPKLSQIKKLKPSKLDHKQNEVWSQSKLDKFTNARPHVLDNTTKYSRRTLSLNELSFEKYHPLLPKGSIGETKLSSSKSLRLTNEFSFKRARSLIRVENNSHIYGDVKGYENNENMEETAELVESISKDDTTEVEIEEKVVVNDFGEEVEINFAEDFENKLPHLSSFSVIQNNLLEDSTLPIDFPVSEDLECENNSIDNESSSDSKSLSRSSTMSNEDPYNIVDENELHKRSYDDFDFVSDILDRSGFNGNDLFAPWYSLDQPLNPSIFDEVEAYWPHENACPKDNFNGLIDDFCNHHQLLFDLINEILVQIYDTSFTYYPRALSSNCRVPPMPAKFNILNELWAKVSKIMNKKLEVNLTVDDIVAQDTWSDDRWMKLQLESECVALELEDMFFDEILEDIIYS